MFAYVRLNLWWTIPLHNVDAYTEAEESALNTGVPAVISTAEAGER